MSSHLIIIAIVELNFSLDFTTAYITCAFGIDIESIDVDFM